MGFYNQRIIYYVTTLLTLFGYIAKASPSQGVTEQGVELKFHGRFSWYNSIMMHYGLLTNKPLPTGILQ